MNWVDKTNRGLDVRIDTRTTNSGRRADEATYKEKYEILKNGRFCDATPRKKSIFINAHKNEFSIQLMCEVLEISEKKYYKNLNNSSRDDHDASLIYEVFNESMHTYGYRRIKQALLEKYGLVMNAKKILRLMKEYHIVPQYSKIRRQTAQKRVLVENVKPNLLKRNFTVDEPDKAWVTDITYIIHNRKRLFLSTIIDLYDRQVVSYIHTLNDIPLVISTLTTARLLRYNAKNTIIHSDQGFQYTSNEYQMWCRKFGFQISMSRKGTPLDNAVIESFHARLKNEVMYNKEFKNMNELKQAIFDWIWFYNHGRIKGKRKTI